MVEEHLLAPTHWQTRREGINAVLARQECRPSAPAVVGGEIAPRVVARQIQDLNARTGVYAVPAFELLKKDHGEAAVREALQTGSRRLRDEDLPDLDNASVRV